MQRNRTNFMSVVHGNISTTYQSPSNAEAFRWSNTALVYATRRTILLLVNPFPLSPLPKDITSDYIHIPHCFNSGFSKWSPKYIRYLNWCFPFRFCNKTFVGIPYLYHAELRN